MTALTHDSVRQYKALDVFTECGGIEVARTEERMEELRRRVYLARHNDVLAPPRELAAAVGRPIEMARSGRRTFCCGAGGAHMWMEERAKPINEERVREASATGADTLAVACPFCTVMLDDGRAAGATTPGDRRRNPRRWLLPRSATCRT